MNELLYKEEVFRLVGFCMEIHRELGKGHDEVIYKDAFVVELQRARIPFVRERKHEVTYKRRGAAPPLLFRLCCLGQDSVRSQGRREPHRRSRQTSLELPRRVKTGAGSARQFRQRFTGVEARRLKPVATRAPD